MAVKTTIELKVRRIDLPPDWLIALSADTVTLAPGEQITGMATAIPGFPGVQGTHPRCAVEGFANGELLGGVQMQVYLPVEQPFFRSTCRWWSSHNIKEAGSSYSTV